MSNHPDQTDPQGGPLAPHIHHDHIHPHHGIEQVGWLGQTGAVYALDDETGVRTEPGGFSPLYQAAEECGCDRGGISDGYHTFRELYDHRAALAAALCRSNLDLAWRTKRHHPDDNPIFDGYFLVGLSIPDLGQVSYHYQLDRWDWFAGITVLPHAPQWDGHTPKGCVLRLQTWTPDLP